MHGGKLEDNPRLTISEFTETGFTGTQHGLTPKQRGALSWIISGLSGWLHHGDCVGADSEAHDIAKHFGLLVAIHPPLNPAKRAWREFDRIFPALDYLPRNRLIVENTTSLIAAPASMGEKIRSGTWSTIRFARSLGRPITLVLPNGSVVMENLA